MPIIQKMILILLGVTLLPIFLIGGIFYLSSQSSLRHQVLGQLAAIATIQQSRMENLIAQNDELLKSFTSRLPLRIELDRYNRLRTSDDKTLLQQSLTDTQAQVGSFKAISVINTDGEVVASTDSGTIGKSYANQTLFNLGRQQNTSNLLRDEQGSPAVYLTGPLQLSGRLIGVAVIKSDSNNLLSFTKDYTGLGDTGETMLIKRRDQGDALYLTALRFDQRASLRRTTSLTEMSSPVVRALDKQEATFTDTVDYQGHSVLAATRYIPATGWGLVVKIDRAEAYQPLAQLADLLLVVIFIISVIIIFVAFYLARRLNEPILALAAAADKIRIGDLSERVRIGSKDEIGQLAAAFNAMASNMEKVDQMKSEFVLLTSHQLRTPATAVKGFISMLLDGYAGNVTSEQKKLIKAAYAENERQISVINSILDVAKLEAGEMMLARTMQDVGRVIEASAAGQAPLLAAKHQTISVKKPKQPVEVMIDAEKFQLVIDNLIHNAIKYSPDETTIEVKLTDSKTKAVIEVLDHGIGIEPSDIPKLFKRFSRIVGPQTVNVQGAGLGLYLADKLITMHGGKIGVRSKGAGRGTTFTIELPKLNEDTNSETYSGS